MGEDKSMWIRRENSKVWERVCGWYTNVKKWKVELKKKCK